MMARTVKYLLQISSSSSSSEAFLFCFFKSFSFFLLALASLRRSASSGLSAIGKRRVSFVPSIYEMPAERTVKLLSL